MFEPRAPYAEHLSQEMQYLTNIEQVIDSYPLDSRMVELVKLRVSQINGCSFCVRYHSERLRMLDETIERMEMVSVWREAPCFTDRERCAFRWAEAVTRLSDGSAVDDELYADAVKQFGEKRLSQLTMAVAMINVWNRFAVPFQSDHRLIPALLAQMGLSKSNKRVGEETCAS